MKTLPLTTLILALIAALSGCTSELGQAQSSGKLVALEHRHGTLGCGQRTFATIMTSENSYQGYVAIPPALVPRVSRLLGKRVNLTTIERASLNVCEPDRVLVEMSEVK